MKTDRKQNIIWKLFLLIFGIDMIIVLFICVAKSENHLPVSKMIMLPVIFVGILCVVGLCLKRLTQFLENASYYLFPVFMICYGILLYVSALSGRCEPVHDQEAVYQGALYFAGLSEEISWPYFARYNNNIMPAIILGVIFRIGSMGGVLDPYYFAVFVNVLQVLLTMYCMYKLSKERNGIVGAWMSVLMLVLFVPIVGHTKALYTDSMSFSFGIIGFYLLWKNERTKNKVQYWGNIVLSGCLIGIGAIIKMTVLIAIVAILIYSLVEKNKRLICNAFGAFIIVVMVIVLGNQITTFLPCEDMKDSYGTPKISYFMGVGLKGNGGYIDNQEYLVKLNTIYGLTEKEEWSNQYIKENMYEFFNREHIIQKLRYNFANGVLGCDIFVHTLENDNILYKLMHYNGEYYWRYAMLMTAYMYTYYILIIICTVWHVIKKQEIDIVCGVSMVAISGIMLYLMLFEANNRQLYNHLPWFILVASSGLSDILNCLRKRKG